MVFFAPVLTWLLGVITSIIGLIATWFGKKIATIAAVIAFWLAIFGAFTAAINAIVNSIYVSMPSGLVFSGMSMLPSNSGQCIAAVTAGQLAAWLYTTQYKALVLKMRA